MVAIKLSSKGFYGQTGKKVAGIFNSGEIILQKLQIRLQQPDLQTFAN
jgi:hypothetical protein